MFLNLLIFRYAIVEYIRNSESKTESQNTTPYKPANDDTKCWWKSKSISIFGKEFIMNKTANISDNEKYIFPFHSNETIPVVIIENLKIKKNANLIACS